MGVPNMDWGAPRIEAVRSKFLIEVLDQFSSKQCSSKRGFVSTSSADVPSFKLYILESNLQLCCRMLVVDRWDISLTT
jgi:hypothetical protein